MVIASTKEKSDFKSLAMLCIGLAIGLLLAYQLNLEKSASVMANERCNVCQDNINTMVENFNILGKKCTEAQNYKDVKVLPALGLNQSIRVYSNIR